MCQLSQTENAASAWGLANAFSFPLYRLPTSLNRRGFVNYNYFHRIFRLNSVCHPVNTVGVPMIINLDSKDHAIDGIVIVAWIVLTHTELSIY
jgi:hypothetical protein